MNKKLSAKELAARAQKILAERYPDAPAALLYKNPWELLVAVVLSAQCTDARVNMVTPDLFARWPGPGELAQTSQEELEGVIRSIGFFLQKAKNLRAAAKLVAENFAGQVPRSMEELVSLPGVARKTANVVLFGAFGINDGIAVDTHVKRLSYRLGLTEQTEPEAVEKDLTGLFPREEWGNVNRRMVLFGREVCMARKPDCGSCGMREFCMRLEPPRKKAARGRP